MYDPTRPLTVLSSVQNSGLLRGLRWSNSALLASAEGGNIRLWDFRSAEARPLWSSENVTLTALDLDPDGYHLTMTLLTAEGLAIQGVDLRRPKTLYKPLLFQDLWQHCSPPGVSNIQDFWASSLSVGVLGEACAVFSDARNGLDYVACFAGGPSTSPLLMRASSLNITALQCASGQCASLVGICEPSRGWAELRWVSRTSSDPERTLRKVKPKKFFRQRDAGENDFRDRGVGRRGRR